jgi:hypothetical protein
MLKYVFWVTCGSCQGNGLPAGGSPRGVRGHRQNLLVIAKGGEA